MRWRFDGFRNNLFCRLSNVVGWLDGKRRHHNGRLLRRLDAFRNNLFGRLSNVVGWLDGKRRHSNRNGKIANRRVVRRNNSFGRGLLRVCVRLVYFVRIQPHSGERAHRGRRIRADGVDAGLHARPAGRDGDVFRGCFRRRRRFHRLDGERLQRFGLRHVGQIRLHCWS